MAGTVSLTIEDGLATLRIGRPHGNAINGELVADLVDAFARAQEEPQVRGVLFAAKGKLFCPGLDLKELIELDRPAMERFLDAFSECVLKLYAFDKPVVAALHGHAVAGGCVISMTADWRVLREGALIGLNEVRVGVPLPFGVSMILRDSVATPRLEEVALFGRNYCDAEAVASGMAHEIHAAEGFEPHCRKRLEELAGKDPRAFSITKRYLRSATVERIRANDAGFRAEFLDAWFSNETQRRLRAIVDELKQR